MQLCEGTPFMCKIAQAHNCIIPQGVTGADFVAKVPSAFFHLYFNTEFYFPIDTKCDFILTFSV